MVSANAPSTANPAKKRSTFSTSRRKNPGRIMTTLLSKAGAEPGKRWRIVWLECVVRFPSRCRRMISHRGGNELSTTGSGSVEDDQTAVRSVHHVRAGARDERRLGHREAGLAGDVPRRLGADDHAHLERGAARSEPGRLDRLEPDPVAHVVPLESR